MEKQNDEEEGDGQGQPEHEPEDRGQSCGREGESRKQPQTERGQLKAAVEEAVKIQQASVLSGAR